MAKRIYKLYCEICEYKIVTDGTNVNLQELKRSPIMADLPKYSETEKKTVQKKPIQLPKKFKCPQCGRLLSHKKIYEEPEKKYTIEDYYDKKTDNE